jgi:translocation and assembly module TamA
MKGGVKDFSPLHQVDHLWPIFHALPRKTLLGAVELRNVVRAIHESLLYSPIIPCKNLTHIMAGCTYTPWFFRISLVLLCILIPCLSHAVGLRVVVQGLEGELQRNVLANLRIAQQQDDPHLSAGQIHRLHRQAEGQIMAALAPFGYYSAQVEGSLTREENRWLARYTVQPGKPVQVEGLHIEVLGPGKEHPALQNLKKRFPLQPGQQLNDNIYEAGKRRILNLALGKGYIQAKFAESRVAVQAKEGKADIRLVLDSGPLHVFGSTSSTNYVLKPGLIQRYLSYRPGDVYSIEALNRLQSDLYATGYFSQVGVDPKVPHAEAEASEVPIELHLQQAPRNRYTLGLGYGTDTGMRGNIGWKNRMINRSGHRPSLNIQLAEKGSRAVGSYEIPVPILDLRYDSLTFDALYSEETWDDTSINQYLLGLWLKHNAPKYQLGAGLEFLHESYSLGSGDKDSTHLLMPGAFFTMILAEDRINTQNGLRISGSVKGAPESPFSSTSFFQFRVGGKIILSPIEKWRVIGRLHVGATVMNSIEDLPPSLRFYAGGDQSVRGYAYKSLGPKNTAGRVVGGQYITEGSVEIERSISGPWSAALFYDLGNAYDDLNAHLKQGLGVGARLTLPFGQIRLDVATALSEPNYPVRIHLTLGADL